VFSLRDHLQTAAVKKSGWQLCEYLCRVATTGLGWYFGYHCHSHELSHPTT